MMILSRATLLCGNNNPGGFVQTAAVPSSEVRVGPQYQAEIPMAFDGPPWCRDGDRGEALLGEEESKGRPSEWSGQEKEAFLLALIICGKEFIPIASFLGTKTVSGVVVDCFQTDVGCVSNAAECAVPGPRRDRHQVWEVHQRSKRRRAVARPDGCPCPCRSRNAWSFTTRRSTRPSFLTIKTQ